MTLVIYKDNILAADSRATRPARSEEVKCTTCNEEVKKVAVDTKQKIKVPVRGSVVYFRKNPILAVAGAGGAVFIRRLIDSLFDGDDIEEVYKNYYKLVDPSTVSSCSWIIVATTKVFLVRTYDPDDPSVMSTSKHLIVKEYTREDTLMIGSGASAAGGMDYLTGSLLTAIDLVEYTANIEKGVGAPIRYTVLGSENASDIKVSTGKGSDIKRTTIITAIKEHK